MQKYDFPQNHAGTDFFFKNEARKLKFGLVVPVYSIYKSMEQIFQILLFFWKYGWLCPKFRTFCQFCPQFWTYFQKKGKFQKSVPSFFRYHIEVPQDQISAS